MPTIQYAAGSARLFVHKLFTFCIWRVLVSRDSRVHGVWLPATEWCQRYLTCCQPASDVAENLGRLFVRSVYASRITLNDSDGKNGNQRVISVVNFQRSVIIAELWQPEVAKFVWEIFPVFGKTTPYGKIFKILFLKFSLRHRSTCYLHNSWHLADGNRWNCAFLTWQIQKKSPDSPAIATGRIAPKICQDQRPTMYSECSIFYPNRFTFGGVMRLNTAKTRRKVNPIFGWSLSLSRIGLIIALFRISILHIIHLKLIGIACTIDICVELDSDV